MSPDREKDKAAVRKWVDNYLSYNKNGETIQKLHLVYTDNAVALPPNGTPIRGIQNIKEWMEPIFEHYRTTSEVQELDTDADSAWVYLSAKDHTKPLDGGDMIESDNKCIWLLRRTADGSWKSTHIMWNSNLPLPTDAPF